MVKVPTLFFEANTSVYTGDLTISSSQNLGPKHITGNLTISGTSVVTLTGTVWVDGTITMGNTTRIEGPGTIVAVGDITVAGNAKLAVENIPLVISTSGDVTVAANNNWTSAVIYAPNGDVLMPNKSNVYGSVIARSIGKRGNGGDLIYPTALRSRT